MIQGVKSLQSKLFPSSFKTRLWRVFLKKYLEIFTVLKEQERLKFANHLKNV